MNTSNVELVNSTSKKSKSKTKQTNTINNNDYLAPINVQRAQSISLNKQQQSLSSLIPNKTQTIETTYKYLTPTTSSNVEQNVATTPQTSNKLELTRPSIINETSLNMSAAKRVSDNISRYSRSSVGSSNKIKPPKSKDIKLLPEFFEDPRHKANRLKKQRKHDIQKMFNDPHAHHSNATKPPTKTTSTNKDEGPNYLDNNYKVAQCHMTFIFDPNGRLSYWMSFIISLAFLYNFWVMIYRYSFNEINSKNKFYWFAFDYFADFLYVCDIMFNFRTGFLEEGVLQTDPIRLRHHYMNTTRFYVDCLCLMPLDILYLSIGYNSILRCFRLVKIYRFWGFLDRTERHTNFPNLFRTVVMLHYLFAIFHWNACFSYFISHYLSEDLMVKPNNVALSHFSSSSRSNSDTNLKYDSNNNNYNNNNNKQSTIFLSNEYDSFSKSFSPFDAHQTKNKLSKSFHLNDQELLRDYLKAFYFSTKIMTLVTDMPNPKTSTDYIFAIVQLVVALLLFATIMGHVSYIVTNLGNARKEFQSKLDAVKTYMSLRRVPQRLQDRVIRWFDFLWTNHKSIDDNQVLNLLPYKLRAEIAIHVHLDTLKRVEIFQNTEAGFLNELVLRLKPVLYSPGDFICRKGEVGKEMYIVNGGKLQVISDNGKIVLATLKAGSYFGEISILNMGASGNRRTASVKSVGYSDLFCLSKEDLWEVLKEYPAVRVKLEAIAVKRLEKHKKPLSEIVNLARCKSSPGLLQASLKQLPPTKGLKRYGTLPTSLLKRTDITFLMMNGMPPNNTTKKNVKMIKYQPKLAITNEKIMPSTSEQINENGSDNNQAQTATVLYNRSVISEDCQTLNEKSQVASEPLIQNYEHEIERLKKYVYYLEAENSSLFSKIDKKNWNIGKNMDDIDIDLKMTKAKIDSDSDEYKV